MLHWSRVKYQIYDYIPIIRAQKDSCVLWICLPMAPDFIADTDEGKPHLEGW